MGSYRAELTPNPCPGPDDLLAAITIGVLRTRDTYKPLKAITMSLFNSGINL
jgi:hypothetical protein